MSEEYKFDSIRPFNDSEIHDVFMRLSSEPFFLRLLGFLFPAIPTSEYLIKLNEITSIKEFQSDVISPYLFGIVRDSSIQLKFSGFEKLSKTDNYFFISNHRDIILDSALLNVLLAREGFETTEIAIGDNLLVYNWITDLVRINKSFIVQRSAPVRQMLEIARQLSAYVRHAITEKKQSVWMAQREGRAKDSDDRTQDSLIKMLCMDWEGDLVDAIKNLNVAPVSITYEYDPCDFLKAQEMLRKSMNSNFKKHPLDDILNMKTGLRGYKGRINLHISEPITDRIEMLRDIPDRAEKVSAISNVIDVEIHKNYKIYSGNYVAYDLLNNSERFKSYYTKEEKERFESYVQGQLLKIEERNEHYDFLQNSIINMYANPLINQLTALGEDI